MPYEDNSVTLENVQILWPNFSGREGPYNREGDRSFNILLTPEQADMLASDGWNVKVTKARELDEGEVTGGEPYLPVSLHYGKGRPPRVVLITERGRTELGEDMVEILDGVEWVNADVMIRPHDWVVTNKSGRKAYLKALYATINEDYLERKYADVKPAGRGSAGQRPIDEE
jgi:hypothetical protein